MNIRNKCSKEKFKFAKRLRKNPTKYEKLLWQKLRCKKLNGFAFRRQSIIFGWIVDFYCPKLHLIIEIDGLYHNTIQQKLSDNKRDDILSESGFNVLRFKNNEIVYNLDDVLDKIKNKCFDNISLNA